VAVLAAVSALTLLASFALDEGSLDAGMLSRLPPCPAKLAGSSCALCGMTHGIVAISHGRIAEGVRWNRGAPWLYAAMVVHVIAGAAFAVRRTRR
jgi:hypothetical protein